MARWSADQPQRPPSKNLRHLAAAWQFIRPYRGLVAAAAVALLVAAGSTLLIGQGLRVLVDRGLLSGAPEAIDRYFLLMFGIVALLAGATFARHYLVSWLGERMVADIRKRVYGHVIGLSPEFFEVTRAGEVLSRLTTDPTLIQSVVGSSASMALRNLVLFLGGAVLLVVTSPKLAALVFGGILFIVAPLLVFGRRVRGLSRKTQDRVADTAAHAGESINAVQTVQAFTHEHLDRAAYGSAVEESFAAARRLVRNRSLLTLSVMLLVFGAVVAVLWIGARDVMAGGMSAGKLTAFIFYSVVTAGAVSALSEVVGDLQRAAGATERLMELLTTPPKIAAPALPVALPASVRGEVAFERVSFSYPTRPDEHALRGFTLRVRPGQRVALVGPSGAGKSTVFQLLLRFYDPQSGRITLDGVTIADADPREVRQRIALVPQDPVIFGTTAAENIRYGRPGATDAEVRAAAETAQAAKFIEALPQGYDTQVGERGLRLSGGQRQRIAIARAILRDAPVLLLDEATSSLDAESESAVQAALGPLMQGRTTLVIAHRLATVLRADHIVVLDHGQIVAQGTHPELVAQGGLYARLAALQFDAAFEEAGRPARVAR
ncbi:MAG: ATP-binding cassette domain-containing protein [Alphaproteobacteria bacterium]|nr:ATP-binding cassette domain-containing protein [Alphaproteobacteria bacterium]